MDNSRQQLKKQVKKHIPKDWLCELRIAYRIVMEAVNDIKRTGIINLVIITTMAAILTLFGVLFRFTLSLSTFANELGNVLEISVYLKSNASASIVKDRIKDIKHVKTVTLKTKEESWNSLKQELGLHDISNPLPDTLRVKVDKPDNISEVFNQIKTISAKKLFLFLSWVTFIPSITMLPLSGFSIPPIILSKVLFPLPLSPLITTKLPSGISKLKLEKIILSPNALFKPRIIIINILPSMTLRYLFFQPT